MAGMTLNSVPDWSQIQKMLAEMQQSQSVANFQPPPQQGYQGPMPYVSPTENQGVAGGINVGPMGISGSTSPHEWAAMLKLRGQF